MTNEMTLTEARTRISSLLETDWSSIGQAARFLGLSRNTVAREVERMASEGRLESRAQRFHRSGYWRIGKAYRLTAAITCGPVELGQ